MSQTKIELYNMAAQILGGRGRLVTTAQSSRAVDVFDLWYPTARKQVLSASHWSSCRKEQQLPIAKERSVTADWVNGDPSPGFSRAYLTPPDMLRPRFLASGEQFQLSALNDGAKCLLTRDEAPILVYTFDQTVVERWEHELFLAVASALAAFSAMTLTGKANVVSYAEEKANQLITASRAASAQEEDAPVQVVATWHAARGYLGSPNYPRFMFPHGQLLSVGQTADVK